MFAQWYDDQAGGKPTRDAVRVAYHGYIPEHATLTYIGDESRMTRYLGRMRWYDARLGRWLTRDPAGYVDGLNVYLFVGGNPLMFVDPTGLARKRGEIWETIKRTPRELWNDGTSVARELKDGLNAVATEAIVLPQYYLGFKTIEEYSRISVFAQAQVGAEIEAARSPSGTPKSTGAAALSTLAIEPPLQTIRAITSGDLDEIERSSWTLALGGVSGLATKQFLLRNPGAVTAGATGTAAPRFSPGTTFDGPSSTVAQTSFTTTGLSPAQVTFTPPAVSLPAGRVRSANPTSLADAIRLNKSLASQQQIGEIGERIAGEGTGVTFRNAGRVAGQYGGSPTEWVKMRSPSHLAPDGTRFETHWVENLRTGQRFEFKTKIGGDNE